MLHSRISSADQPQKESHDQNNRKDDTGHFLSPVIVDGAFPVSIWQLSLQSYSKVCRHLVGSDVNHVITYTEGSLVCSILSAELSCEHIQVLIREVLWKINSDVYPSDRHLPGRRKGIEVHPVIGSNIVLICGNLVFQGKSMIFSRGRGGNICYYFHVVIFHRSYSLSSVNLDIRYRIIALRNIKGNSLHIGRNAYCKFLSNIIAVILVNHRLVVVDLQRISFLSAVGFHCTLICKTEYKEKYQQSGNCIFDSTGIPAGHIMFFCITTHKCQSLLIKKISLDYTTKPGS